MKKIKYKAFKPNVKFSISSLVIFMIVSIFSISIGYSSMSTELLISGAAYLRTEKDIRITDVKLVGTTNGGSILYNPDYSVDTIITGIHLPNIDSTITYQVKEVNFTKDLMNLKEINIINLNNPDITFSTSIDVGEEIEGYEEKDFFVTFHYRDELNEVPTNTSLESRIQYYFDYHDNTPPVMTKVDNVSEYFITDAKNMDLASKVISIDDVDGDITKDIKVISDIDFNNIKPGEYPVTYISTDKAGNTSTLTINVVIWNFKRIEAGVYHGIALTTHGEVYSWGWNGSGARGQGTSGSSNTQELRVPTKVERQYFHDKKIIDIAAGDQVSVALNEDGEVFTWGNGALGGLGTGNTTNQNRPVNINFPDNTKMKQVSHFSRTGASLGYDGNIYTWGYSTYGSTGDGTSTNRNTPVRITSTGNFKQLSQGQYGGAAVTTTGEVYVWGTNVEGQLARGSSGGSGFTPTKIDNIDNIKEVSYGRAQILALSNDGRVFAWGQGGSGRLGTGSTSNVNSSISEVANVSNVSKINAALDYSQFLVNNNIYSTGNGNYGVLFSGSTRNISMPEKSTMINVENNVSDIAGRNNTSFILSLDGTTVWGIGSADTAGSNFGSNVHNSNSSSVAISWTFTP